MALTKVSSALFEGDSPTFTELATLTGTTPQLDFKQTSGAHILASVRAEVDSGTGGKLVISTKRDGDAAVDRLTIDDDGAATFTGSVTATSLDISGNIDVDGVTNLDVLDIDGAVDMASTLAVGGVVTANAGVVVDNITIDGYAVTSTSDILLDSAFDIIFDADANDVLFKDGGTEYFRITNNGTSTVKLDAVGDIILDADGGDIYLDDGGTGFGQISGASSNLTIKSSTVDKDILFQGNHGGSAITALTLDMSNAGEATFNSGFRATSATINSKISIYTDSNGAEIDNNSGNFTIDTPGDIILDADGGDVIFKDGGASRGSLKAGTNAAFELKSLENNADFVIKGIDNNAEITALTFDMSEAGAATFSSTISAVGSANSTSASHIPALLGSGSYGGGIATRDGAESGWYQQTSGADWHFYHNRTVASQTPESKKVLSFNSTGAATFNSSITSGGVVTVANGSTTGTYGLRHEGSGKYFQVGVPNASYTYFQTDANAGFNFEANIRAAGNIHSVGNISIAAGAGIQLGGTAEANKLDDYEEGTWTPELIRSDGTSIATSYTYRSGTYTIIGNVITLRFGLYVGGVQNQNGTELKISGLPITWSNLGGYQEPTASMQAGNFNTTAALAGALYIFGRSGTAQFGIRGGYTNADSIVSVNEIKASTYLNATITAQI